MSMSKPIQYGSVNDASPLVGKHVTREEANLKVDARFEDDDMENAVAIIGMSGFFPESDSVGEFLQKLESQQCLFKQIPQDHYPEKSIAKRYGAFLKDISFFDNELFNIPAVEAQYLDPRQRLLLMSTWQAMENACYLPADLEKEKVDVYIASEGTPYSHVVDQVDVSPYSSIGVNGWALPNRISHHFRLSGKSLYIDTACSGSSAALYEAVQALRRAEANYAIVGAANLLFDKTASHYYLGQDALGILMDDNKCSPFQDEAKGFLPAEGVATVILKKYTKALQDGDNIHGVLRGIAMNHVAGYGSLTMPSANAQAEVISAAHLDAGVDPNSITYLEAHAASSLLADTEEIKAFIQARQQLADKLDVVIDRPCKISTSKPNVGHANSVSGMIALFRVLHSMKVQKKFGVQGFKGLAKSITLSNSRFYITEETENWERLADAQDQPIPRRAIINNFGAGGVNVCFIVEEALNTEEITREDSLRQKESGGTFFLGLSTASDEQLTRYAQDLLTYLQGVKGAKQADVGPSIGPSAEQLEYLFWRSRSSMDQRVVYRFKTVDDLVKKLEKYTTSSGERGFCFKGDRSQAEIPETFRKYAKLGNFVDELGAKEDKAILFELWSKGLNVPLDKLYQDKHFKKISLPGYPFRRVAFWLRTDPRNSEGAVGNHPLLQKNISDFHQHAFSTRFRAKDRLLAEHLVKGDQVLPGVVYLEMARAAIKDLAKNLGFQLGLVCIRDVLWMQPLIVNDAHQDVQIWVEPEKFDEDACRVSFQIISYPEKKEQSDSEQKHDELEQGDCGRDEALTVHAQGTALLSDDNLHGQQDLQALKAELNSRVISAEQCYQRFQSVGIEHRDYYQRVSEIYLGIESPRGGREALAKLDSSSVNKKPDEQLVLDPGILDSATQATISLLSDFEPTEAGSCSERKILPPLRTFLPFALEEIHIGKICEEQMWAWARCCDNQPEARDKTERRLHKFDIDIFNSQGELCISMRGFSIRALDERLSRARQSAAVTNPPVELLTTPQAEFNVNTLEGFSRQFLIDTFCHSLKFERSKIDADTFFENYGLNSLAIIEVTKALERVFGQLPKTLLFEHQTISDLAKYFLARYSNKLEQLSRSENYVGLKPSASSATMLKRAIDSPAVSKNANKKKAPGLIRLPKNNSHLFSRSDDIAIIGMDCRFAGAQDVNELWSNLAQGKDCVTEIPADRWDWKKYYSADRTQQGKHFGKWGGFISGVDEFDPFFFNISPKEAETLDPQERLFVSSAWKALEDAGLTRADLQNLRSAKQPFDLPAQVGVYAGVMFNEYQLFGLEKTLRGSPIGFASTSASVANRVSYVLNVHGPSLTVDSMCSSSLSAVHMACEDLKSARCDMAIAGGVNTILHPNKYYMLSAGNFLSSAGQCASFGEGGDGYVPGEGVGVLILKRLQDAIENRDPIYAVIKGSAINHAGNTSGFTVPSPQAQSLVVERALRQANINPEQVSYLEAHGTGTQLGDPIEISGLEKAFRNTAEIAKSRQATNGERDNNCRIGSIKSNIGHCEGAAGVAGIIKVIMQLKHKKIAPSLHSKSLNVNIDFDKSPFTVNQSLSDWPAPQSAGDADKPGGRCAGISSFGAGGSNAHIILQEYVRESEPVLSESQVPALIVLSAKNKERLRVYAELLKDFSDQQETLGNKGDLLNLAYTLQIGREAMGTRLALIVQSFSELSEKLAAFIAKGELKNQVHFAECHQHRVTIAVLKDNQDLMQTVSSWLTIGKYGELLDLWVKGLDINWAPLYRQYHGLDVRRISAPTYPFAREKYWVEIDGVALRADQLFNLPQQNAARRGSVLRGQNSSGFNTPRYSFTFDGNEYFFSDHRIKQQKILPAVVYLEMVRDAAMQALQNAQSNAEFSLSADEQINKAVIRFSNLLWLRPLIHQGEALHVHVCFTLLDKDKNNGLRPLKFEVIQSPADAHEIVHCRGQLEYDLNATNTYSTKPSLNELLESFSQSSDDQQAATTTPEQCYQAFAELGIHYGATHQSLSKIIIGKQNENPQVLARLNLPVSLGNQSQTLSVLEPSLLDGALQASIGLFENTGEAKIPFALGELAVHGKCTAEMWAWLREDTQAAGAQASSALNIDIFNGSGELCASMAGLSLRSMNATSAAYSCSKELLLYAPRWQIQEPTNRDALTSLSPWGQHHLISIGITLDPSLQEHLACEYFSLDIAGFNASGFDASSRKKKTDLDTPSIASAYLRGAEQLLLKVQEILRQTAEAEKQQKCFVQVLMPHGHGWDLLAGQLALLKSAQIENSHLRTQLLQVDRSEASYVIDCLKQGLALFGQQRLRFSDRGLERSTLLKLTDRGEKPLQPWQEGGVYLITGGLGGLGLIFAKEILQKTQLCQVILTGRTSKSDSQWQDDKQRLLGAELGEEQDVDYMAADVSEPMAVAMLMERVENRYGKLNGIIHSAGLLNDKLLINKSAQELRKVLLPKVLGTSYLYEQSRRFNLDFLALFSSISGALGNIGQADYAAANAFLDEFARYTESTSASNHVFSINWPLWKNGGMRLDEALIKNMQRTTGVQMLDTATGLEAFYCCLASGEHQLCVLKGEVQRIEKSLAIAGLVQLSGHQKSDDKKSDSELFNQQQKNSGKSECSGSESDVASLDTLSLADSVIRIIQKIIKTTREINQEQALLELGFDSIMALDLVTQVRQAFDVELQLSDFMQGMSALSLIKTIEQMQVDESEQAEEDSVSEMVEIEI